MRHETERISRLDSESTRPKLHALSVLWVVLGVVESPLLMLPSLYALCCLLSGEPGYPTVAGPVAVHDLAAALRHHGLLVLFGAARGASAWGVACQRRWAAGFSTAYLTVCVIEGLAALAGLALITEQLAIGSVPADLLSVERAYRILGPPITACWASYFVWCWRVGRL